MKTIGEGYKITQIIEHYGRTASGNSWQAKPYQVDEKQITAREYNNYVDSCSWFNSFPGGSCRAYSGYTYAGYLPIRIVTVAPGRKTKLVARFIIDLDR